jgi:hypothetical protein
MRDYSSIEWSKYFELSDESPSGIKWKAGQGKPGNKGGIAGTKCYDCRSKLPGSWQVKAADGAHWLVHRIILVMKEINILGKVIDHIDGNPFNNKISNLRVTTQMINCQNQRIRITNTSGVAGVSIKVNKQGRTYFGAYWTTNKKRITKYFSIDDFGYEKAFDMACKHRKLMLENLNKDGANYSERHGL